MESGLTIRRSWLIYRSLIIDGFALLFIYSMPALSHLFNLPVYFIEPMRLMLVLALVHTNKHNAYVLALTLPVFSLFLSGHPVPLKTALISAELFLNVYLFYLFSGLLKRSSVALLLSIIGSKLVYYLLKYMLIAFVLLESSLFSTPLLIQLLTTLVFSAYMFLILDRKRNDTSVS